MAGEQRQAQATARNSLLTWNEAPNTNSPCSPTNSASPAAAYVLITFERVYSMNTLRVVRSFQTYSPGGKLLV
jgi:hypothetical protein